MSYISVNNSCPVIQNTHNSNTTKYFKDTDSPESFIKNKDIFGTNWYYYEKPITYQYNSWGYRSMEFDELKDDYILVFGCSFTEGVGLYHSDMWSTKLGLILDMDILNLGMGATGPDFQMYNTLLYQNFILGNKKFPKYVIYQWPFKHRTFYTFLNQENKSLDIELFSPTYPEDLYPKNAKEYGPWYISSYMENCGERMKNVNFSIMTCNNIWKSMDIPVIHWTWNGDFDIEYSDYFFKNDITLLSIDDTTGTTGRDLSHNGHLSQDIVVNEILKTKQINK